MEDVSLPRIAFISRKPEEESENFEMIKDVLSCFNVNLVYTEGSEPVAEPSRESEKEKSIAELSVGFLECKENGEERSQSWITLNVCGDYRPLWPFVAEFADLVVVELNSGDNLNVKIPEQTIRHRISKWFNGKARDRTEQTTPTKVPNILKWINGKESNRNRTGQKENHLPIADKMLRKVEKHLKDAIFEQGKIFESATRRAIFEINVNELGEVSEIKELQEYVKEIEKLKSLDNLRENLSLQKSFELESEEQRRISKGKFVGNQIETDIINTQIAYRRKCTYKSTYNILKGLSLTFVIKC